MPPDQKTKPNKYIYKHSPFNISVCYVQDLVKIKKDLLIKILIKRPLIFRISYPDLINIKHSELLSLDTL